MKQVDRSVSPDVEQRYVHRIAHAHFVRFHMSLILAAVIASGVLTSKGLLAMGVFSLRQRYPLGVLASYLVFLLLVRIWIWYVSLRCVPDIGFGNFDVGGGGFGSGSSSGGGGFGGGDSGGGGASSSWDSDAPAVAPSGWLPSVDLDCDLDDGWWVLVLLAVLAIAIVGAGGYLVYAAPQILPEAAGQALLAGTLTRIAKQEHHSWMTGVLRSTCLPFAAVLILVWLLGWEAHRVCPAAPRLMDVFHCASLH